MEQGKEGGINDPELRSMFAALTEARPEVLPSKFWSELNDTNLSQLESGGYENFKRTVALNYFTWIIAMRSPQMRFLLKNNPFGVFHSLLAAAFSKPYNDVSWNNRQRLSWKTSAVYNFYTRMLWGYALKNSGGALDGMEEPQEGNPFDIRTGGKLISQDLANSALEFYSIMGGMLESGTIKTIIELGGGYGRNAYFFIKKMPHARYIMVDIPPALWVAQKYLSAVFPGKKVFRFRNFKFPALANSIAGRSCRQH